MQTILATSYTQFDSYQVTKRIYRRFQAAGRTFCRHIQGIANETEQLAYMTLMLKRLLVLYFLQKQDLLDANRSYLSNRLQYMQQHFGHDTFYRHFLLPLCFEHLSQQQSNASSIFGTIPSCGIPLFQKHVLECSYPTIAIADEAFIDIFAFFDTYQWQIDGHSAKNDNELHPHIGQDMWM